jgi:hypothetical protein
MRRMLVLLCAIALCVAIAVPANAITYGEPDEDGHPFVGLVTFQSGDGNYLWRCSGTLLSETVFLTAGHCAEPPAASAEIFFDPGPIDWDEDFSLEDRECGDVEGFPCAGGVGGTPYTHPDYNEAAFWLYDLGVVVLDEPMEMDQYGELPEPDELDSLPRRAVFTAVGYGLQRAFPDAAAWKDEDTRTRMVAHPRLVQINTGFTGDGSLVLSNNAKTGGTCFGDSGGPNFVGNTNVVGGVSSFGMSWSCGGIGGVYRVDRADDLAWLATFLS